MPETLTKANVGTFVICPVSMLIESPHNPRRRVNEAALNGLAASITEHGILTPLLARPQGDKYEMAAGHRRRRAAIKAGIEKVPVLVREMTDQQFMEILTVENLQREDVHAYEEASGYQELLKLPGYDVTAVAGKIGRSESYVRSRLRLLDLIPEVVEEFLADGITLAHARLIAPLPPEKQTKALGQCFAMFGSGLQKRELLPPSELREWIRDDGGEDLADAPFALNDADLVPAAGACITCPKSTCTEGRLFGDEQGGETCYDKACFEGKLDAHIAKLKTNGLVAIAAPFRHDKTVDALPRNQFTEIEVREPAPPSSAEPGEDDDAENDYIDPTEQTCAFMEDAVVASGHSRGRVTRICRNEDCPIHGSKQKAAPKDARPDEPSEWQKQRDLDAAKQKAEWQKRKDLYETIVTKWAPLIDREVLFLLVVDGLDKIHHHPLLVKIAEDLGVERQTRIEEQRAVLYTKAEKANQLWLRGAFIQLFFAEHVEREEWDRGYDLLAIASDTLKDLITEKDARGSKAKPEKKSAPKKAAKK